MILIILITAFALEIRPQNLIQNPSFSEVREKKDPTRFYMLLPGQQSEVKQWYLPEYINYELNTRGELSIYRTSKYYSSRDKSLVPTDGKLHYNKTTNGDQLFEDNLGFVEILGGPGHSPPIVQQALMFQPKEGTYCLKFRYKYMRYRSSYDRSPFLDFIFSPTDLREYYTGEAIKAPEKLVKVHFKDTINDTDENSPWQQLSFKIHLSGNERFLSFGALQAIDPFSWEKFFVDDIELYELKDSSLVCRADTIQKDLRNQYKREFPLDKKIESDTLVMYYPPFNSGSDIISPEAKHYLRNIVSFMQRNPSIKIKFLELGYGFKSDTKARKHQYFERYLTFYGINKNRISAERIQCDDTRELYCGRNAVFVKIGCIFYR